MGDNLKICIKQLIKSDLLVMCFQEDHPDCSAEQRLQKWGTTGYDKMGLQASCSNPAVRYRCLMGEVRSHQAGGGVLEGV